MHISTWEQARIWLSRSADTTKPYLCTSRLPGYTTYGHFFQICQFKRKQKMKVFQDFFPERNEPSVHNPVTSALIDQEATNIQKVKVGG